MPKTKFISFLLTMILLISTNSNLDAQQEIKWDGYLQYRFTDNYLDQINFSIRRAKFWLNGSLPDAHGNWSYKLQAAFQQKDKFLFQLEDIMIKYTINNFEITAGQFVPNFCLQRKQSSSIIPLDERAGVSNSLIPTAETIARDIGIEMQYNINTSGSLSFGFFNGNGANNISTQRNFLLINHGKLFLINSLDSKLELGYSLSFREAHNLMFTKIFGDNISFSGKDLRWGIEGKFNEGPFELQSEYIEARLGNQSANGYYILLDYMLALKNLIAVSYEKLNDLNPVTSDEPWYTVGYSYLIKGHEIKLSLNNRFQFTTDKTNTMTTLQIQYFFNQ